MAGQTEPEVVAMRNDLPVRQLLYSVGVYQGGSLTEPYLVGDERYMKYADFVMDACEASRLFNALAYVFRLTGMKVYIPPEQAIRARTVLARMRPVAKGMLRFVFWRI